jgi:pimeloyl-ACP methyl ester carboxylesterase
VTGPEVRVYTLAPGEPGQPVVAFAHGLEDSWPSWLPMAARLDPRWRLLALDLPWRAGNDYGWRHRRPGSWLAEALGLLDGRPDLLVTHSYGANAALELLTAGDPAAGHAVAMICPLYRMQEWPVSWRMLERSRATFVQHIREGVLLRVGGRAGSLEPDVLEAMLKVTVDRVGPRGFLAVFDQFTQSPELPLHRVDRPALVVAGGADPTLALPAARELGARIPGAKLWVNEEYDHFCHIRHARAIATQIAEFTVAGLAAATAGESP